MNIRIGNTFVVEWYVITNGEVVSLSGRNLTLFIQSSSMRMLIPQFEIEDNIIRFKIEGASNLNLGVYTITLYDNFGETNQSVIDVCEAFSLVSRMCSSGVVEGTTVSVASNINIITGGQFYNDNLRYSHQILTPDQQRIARENIGLKMPPVQYQLLRIITI